MWHDYSKKGGAVSSGSGGVASVKGVTGTENDPFGVSSGLLSRVESSGAVVAMATPACVPEQSFRLFARTGRCFNPSLSQVYFRDDIQFVQLFLFV